MSVLIKGMKMPTCCEECAFVKTVGLDRWKCKLSGCDFNSWDVGWGDGTENKYIRHSSCPLVEVPPHGRLIDADALEKEAQKRMLICSKNDNQFQKPYEVMRAIALAPTVIEAEDGE